MKIQYLTWLYEKTGKHTDELELPIFVKTINDLMDYLEIEKPECSDVFKKRHVIYSAINNEIKPHDHPITNQCDVSFFSAIVGG